jgi:hypothetical protein
MKYQSESPKEDEWTGLRRNYNKDRNTVENTVAASCNHIGRHDIFQEIIIDVTADLFLEMWLSTCLS